MDNLINEGTLKVFKEEIFSISLKKVYFYFEVGKLNLFLLIYSSIYFNYLIFIKLFRFKKARIYCKFYAATLLTKDNNYFVITNLQIFTHT